jgi:hypothetical protein
MYQSWQAARSTIKNKKSLQTKTRYEQQRAGALVSGFGTYRVVKTKKGLGNRATRAAYVIRDLQAVPQDDRSDDEGHHELRNLVRVELVWASASTCPC